MRRILITGARRGLGLALVHRALARGDRVFAGVRSLQDGIAPHPQLTVLPLDVAEPRSIAAAVASVSDQVDGLDLLINNAAIHGYSPELAPSQRNLRLGELEPTGLLRMFQVNALGPLLVTQAFSSLLCRGDGPLVLNLGSRKGALAQRQEGGNYGYPASKAALHMLSRTLAFDLLPLGVVVVAVHPGWVRTAMGGPGAELDAEQAADALLRLARDLGPADAGRLLQLDGQDLAC